MGLAATFEEVIELLPEDWTDLELDLRIDDEERYIEAATLLVTCNARPYSRYDWHWRIAVAHRFGHAAAPEAVHSALAQLDRARITGELRARDVQVGRTEVHQLWGRPYSVREELARMRAQ
jgi:hypothetical protein